MTMTIENVFEWLASAATGGLDVIIDIARNIEGLFVSTTEAGTNLTLIGALVIAGVGAPLAWKFIKYIISLFHKVKPN